MGLAVGRGYNPAQTLSRPNRHHTRHRSEHIQSEHGCMGVVLTPTVTRTDVAPFDRVLDVLLIILVEHQAFRMSDERSILKLKCTDIRVKKKTHGSR